MRQYKRISKNPQASVPCPICNNLVIPRGMGGHIRLAHPEQVPNAVKQLSEPELPFEVESVVKAKKKVFSKPLSKEEQLHRNRMLFVGLVGLAITYIYKANKLAKENSLINLRESQKLEEARINAAKVSSQLRRKANILYSSSTNEY